MRRPFRLATERQQEIVSKSADASERRRDKWLLAGSIVSAFATAGLLSVAIFGYIYTVLPAYERDLLARDVRQLQEKQLEATGQLSATKAELNSRVAELAAVNSERLRLEEVVSVTGQRLSEVEKNAARRLRESDRLTKRERWFAGFSERALRRCVADLNSAPSPISPDCFAAQLKSDPEFERLSNSDQQAVRQRLGLSRPNPPTTIDVN